MNRDDIRRMAILWASIARIEALRLRPPAEKHPGAYDEQAELLDALANGMSSEPDEC